MIVYLDSSALLRIVFNEANAFSDLRSIEKVYSSRLLQTESKRVLHRMLLEHILDEEEYIQVLRNAERVIRAISVLRVTENVLLRAEEPLASPLGTLDAIHLATAVTLKMSLPELDLHFLTHDKRLGKAAMGSGFPVIGL